ncbi:MAG: hypothetical protein K8T89_10205 [Planctomycetes bacterium]|nr:hypothetical protein [Planctomycetota bacterium]
MTTRASFTNVSNKTPLSIAQMAADLGGLTSNSLVVIGDSLTYWDGERAIAFDTPPALFGWINKYADIGWSRIGVTKAEFHAGLRQHLQRYEWISPDPHFPELPSVYYPFEPPEAYNTGALDGLLNRFRPSTPEDRQLILAMIMTFFWGGPAGKRPMFTITSGNANDPQHGVGAGKTTLVEMLSRLVGGNVALRPNLSPDRMLSVLLSPSCWPLRIGLIDNLKTYRFSNDVIESLVTCDTINGHRLHHGHASRPNYLTYVVTVNGASFSKDVAQRSVVIKINRPQTSGDWHAGTAAFINQYRQDIIGDIRWHLEQPQQEINNIGRWDRWVSEVLARIDNPQPLLQRILARQSEIDEDNHDSADFEAHLRACISSRVPRMNPAAVRVFIPRLLMTRWVLLLKTGMSDRQAATYVRQHLSPRLVPHRVSANRGYMWRGELSNNTTIVHDLCYTVDESRRK